MHPGPPTCFPWWFSDARWASEICSRRGYMVQDTRSIKYSTSNWWCSACSRRWGTSASDTLASWLSNTQRHTCMSHVLWLCDQEIWRAPCCLWCLWGIYNQVYDTPKESNWHSWSRRNFHRWNETITEDISYELVSNSQNSFVNLLGEYI